MTTLVTGGTGFIGAHVVRALLDRGDNVRCFVRSTSRRDNLATQRVEIVEGDITDPQSVDAAVKGCDRIFHCAADYRFFARDPQELYSANVVGTENVLSAAARAGRVDKIVYTSSVGTLATSTDGTPVNEDTPSSLVDMIGHYKRSKFQAEEVARRWIFSGLPIVIVNPSTPVGELDIKPTPTGKMIVDFLRGLMRAFVDTGLNLIDVRDVAAGHVLASEHGMIGDRYILGHRNVSLRELFIILSEKSGVPPPVLKLPHWVPLAFSRVENAWAKARQRTPVWPYEAVLLSTKKMYFDSSKAIRELCLPQTPIEDALERAVFWFRGHGYA